ncbi:MerR family transcriptional regulator [Massilia litorea]|uniref:MerR family transcriptional regulator n=1 Tax=Massilia litorea TaxID=2769491 RepID=A0A7L9U754_9BURK|nr:MerR family transcriptional regulator [Massilia litorea]QOL50092.1 MerR family transcriptional regulator [Massilia litorea]
MLLKIGQLARQTGLTVRTLHHYDAIGLLRPSGRADNGYRMYNERDVARLHQVQALRRLGLGLEEAGALLAGEHADIGAVVARQVAQLNSQIGQATLLRDRLLRLQEGFASTSEPDLQEWLTTLELMAVFDKHLTPEETARWRAHAQENQGAEAASWKALTAEMGAMMRAGVPPSAPEAQDGARRWMALVDPHLKRSLPLMLKMDALYRDEPQLQAAVGFDPALLDYVGQAANHYRLGLYARHLEPAQLEAIRERYLRHPNGAWVALSRDLSALMERGVPPGDPDVLALCVRWRGLFEECWGSDPDIRKRILHAQAIDPLLALGSIWDTPLRAYLEAGIERLDAQEASHA